MVTLVAFAWAVPKNAAGWICRSRPHASTEPSAHCRHGVLHIPGNLYRSQGAEVRPSLQERGGKCAATTLPRDLLCGELGEASLGLDFPGSSIRGERRAPAALQQALPVPDLWCVSQWRRVQLLPLASPKSSQAWKVGSRAAHAVRRGGSFGIDTPTLACQDPWCLIISGL